MLGDLAFCEAKVASLGVDALIGDFEAALASALPAGRDREVLEGLARALELRAHELRAEPEALFPVLYNQGAWHDRLLPSPGGELEPRDAPAVGPRASHAGPLFSCLETWRRSYEASGRPWIRSLAPPPAPLAGALLRTLAGHTYQVNACAVTPGGTRVVSVSDDKTLKVWDLTTGGELATFRADGALEALALSPGGRHAVAGGGGGHVYFLELVGF